MISPEFFTPVGLRKNDMHIRTVRRLFRGRAYFIPQKCSSCIVEPSEPNFCENLSMGSLLWALKGRSNFSEQQALAGMIGSDKQVNTCWLKTQFVCEALRSTL